MGPFFGLAFPRPGEDELVADADPHAVRLHGTVYDGDGAGVPDALIELWQPDPGGRIAQDGAAFTGWGRAGTDAAGHYQFITLTPGSVHGGRPAFFAVAVFARGLLNRLCTRAYLPDADPEADPLLAGLGPRRRATLLCIAESDSGRSGYRFDIHLQGPAETVFLAYRSERR